MSEKVILFLCGFLVGALAGCGITFWLAIPAIDDLRKAVYKQKQSQ